MVEEVEKLIENAIKTAFPEFKDYPFTIKLKYNNKLKTYYFSVFDIFEFKNELPDNSKIPR